MAVARQPLFGPFGLSPQSYRMATGFCTSERFPFDAQAFLERPGVDDLLSLSGLLRLPSKGNSDSRNSGGNPGWAVIVEAKKAKMTED